MVPAAIAGQRTEAGRTLLLAAGDTFRAAAAEQLSNVQLEFRQDVSQSRRRDNPTNVPNANPRDGVFRETVSAAPTCLEHARMGVL